MRQPGAPLDSSTDSASDPSAAVGGVPRSPAGVAAMDTDRAWAAPYSRKGCAMNDTHRPASRDVVATPLRRCVDEELTRYFEALEGEQPCDLHKMVIGETEHALLDFVLERTGGNQSLAAQMLGLNRGTLRKKLQYYGLL